MARSVRPAAVLAAEALHDIARSAIAKHRKDCGTCHAALRAGRYDRTCETGWLLVKDERAEHVRLAAAEAAAATHASHQLTLFA